MIVDFVMRYTPPFAPEVIERLQKEDIGTIYLIPLYPQYSTTTTKSSLEDFEVNYKKVDGKAQIKNIKDFFENEKYNRAILEQIKLSMNGANYKEFAIIFSAHGLPQKIVDAGDVYEKHVNQHVELLHDMMLKDGMNFNEFHLAYQSKVGPMKWLEPSLEDKLHNLKIKKVLIYPIAFTIDNSETDFELDIEYREIAQELDFEDYRVAKCLNDSDLFVDALIEIYETMK